MFSSKTPRDLNRDPEPWDIRGENNRWRYDDKRARVIIDNPDVYGNRITAHYDPRPEYDHPQHNPPNPILVEFRNDVALNPGVPAAHLALIWCDRGLFAFEAEGATLAHAAHARAVLERLARLEAS